MTEMMTQRMRLKEMKNSCTLQSPVCYRENQSCGSVFIESGSGSTILSEPWSGSNPDPGFWWPKTEEKKYNRKFFNIFFWSQIAIYLRPSYRRSLHPSKQNIQYFKKWNFLIFSMSVGNFCPHGSGSGLRIWIRIRIQEPNWIRIQSGWYGYGSTTTGKL